MYDDVHFKTLGMHGALSFCCDMCLEPRGVILLPWSRTSNVTCNAECRSMVAGQRTPVDRTSVTTASPRLAISQAELVFVLLLAAWRSAWQTTGIRVVPRDPFSASIAFTFITRDVRS
ncbi:hypothetical protein Aduo_005396 [Ancylostoma duodenale]